MTNHQYVQFLNQLLPRVRVEGDVVKGNDQIWLLLGKVAKDYEPIIYRDGKFSIQDSTVSSNPVVRVTGYGAAAYASFYGRRLPTEEEWIFAKIQGGNPEQISSTKKSDYSETMINQEMMMDMDMQSPARPEPFTSRGLSQTIAPVILFLPNAYGIRGMDHNVEEWSLMSDIQNPKVAQYMILPSFLSREPWEAFEEVGFRCALSVPSENAQTHEGEFPQEN